MSETRRVLLKMSGEALCPSGKGAVIDASFTKELATEIKAAASAGVQIGIVVGGGNIFRGSIGQSLGMDRYKGDYMGMLATVINGLAMESALLSVGQPACVFSAFAVGHVVPGYAQPAAEQAMNRGEVVILAGGSGNPYFTTDTAAALRAVELHCDELLKATKVDGVYSKDPAKFDDAELYDSVSFDEALAKSLRVMDQTAFSLCRDNNLPIRVFSQLKAGNIQQALLGKAIGTTVGK